jgi:hypothetical protein
MSLIKAFFMEYILEGKTKFLLTTNKLEYERTARSAEKIVISKIYPTTRKEFLEDLQKLINAI